MLHGRDWLASDGASPEDLACLRAAAPGLPHRYLELLAFSNGGKGPLAVRPYYICLDPAAMVAEASAGEKEADADLAGFLIFGSNGGGEYLAFDTRGGAPWPVVMIDMVAGKDSVEVVAPDFNILLEFTGIEADGV